MSASCRLTDKPVSAVRLASSRSSSSEVEADEVEYPEGHWIAQQRRRRRAGRGALPTTSGRGRAGGDAMVVYYRQGDNRVWLQPDVQVVHGVGRRPSRSSSWCGRKASRRTLCWRWLRRRRRPGMRGTKAYASLGVLAASIRSGRVTVRAPDRSSAVGGRAGHGCGARSRWGQPRVSLGVVESYGTRQSGKESSQASAVRGRIGRSMNAQGGSCGAAASKRMRKKVRAFPSSPARGGVWATPSGLFAHRPELGHTASISRRAARLPMRVQTMRQATETVHEMSLEMGVTAPTSSNGHRYQHVDRILATPALYGWHLRGTVSDHIHRSTPALAMTATLGPNYDSCTAGGTPL